MGGRPPGLIGHGQRGSGVTWYVGLRRILLGHYLTTLEKILARGLREMIPRAL